MGAHAPNPPKVFDFSTFSPFIAAIVAAGGAFALFEPKLERMRAIKNEVGGFERGFLVFYVVPQRALIVLSVVLVLFLTLACVEVIQPNVLGQFPLMAVLRKALDIHDIAWTVTAATVLAIIIRWNWIPQLLLLVARGLSALPIPGLRERFGPDGASVGWHQAKAVCEGPDKGAPLLIKTEELERVARAILSKLSQQAGHDDFAATPIGLAAAQKANIALFGCILEANFSVNRWDRPKWSEFYAALADTAIAKPLFEPAQLLAFTDGATFFEALREELDKALTKRGQPPPPNKSLDAAGDIVRAWDLLKKRARGDAMALIPRYAGLIGGDAAWLDRRLRAFPRMNGDGMRPQLIKLLTRWGCLTPTDGIFNQPFSRSVAWLLLQEGVLIALPETKEVTFNSYGQAPVSRLAMKRLLGRVAELVDQGASSEAQTVASRLGRSQWRRFEAGDFVLWSWANAERKSASGAGASNPSSGAPTPWDKARWRWKLESDRVLRQS